MTPGFTQEQLQDLIYVGAFYYEALLRRDNLINDRKSTISGTVPYAIWEIYMLCSLSNLDVRGLDTKLREIKFPTWDLLLLSKVIPPNSLDNHDQLITYRRYLPNAYVRSKASLLGALTISRNITNFAEWRLSVLSGLSDDESKKVQPYLPEVFGTSEKLVRDRETKSHDARPITSKSEIPMSRNQRITLIVGAVILVIMLVLPPWHFSGGRSAGYNFLFWPPRLNISIDFGRLFLQCVLVAAVTAGTCLLFKFRRQ